jgi:excisionase family DNA binding protein
MTRPYSYQKWSSARTWPGGGWGEALAQVRKTQHLTQGDIADYLGVSVATMRKWEDGTALPDRALWPKLEEAMGLPVPDPRVPEHTPAERELIDTMLLVVDELRLLRERIAGIRAPASTQPVVDEPKVLDVNQATEYLGVSPSFIRRLAYEREVVYYKIGSKVRFRRTDLDQFIEDGKRELPEFVPSQLRGRAGQQPRKRGS